MNGCRTPENIYGSAKRLEWIISRFDKSATVVEFGCGTGYMITLPLAKMGYHIIGVDTDEKSIDFGQEIFRQHGLDPDTLQTADLAGLDIMADVIIASEVLEHISEQELGRTLEIIRDKLKANGRLLVTVPNGYGWFELESFLWFKARLGHLLWRLGIQDRTKTCKLKIFGIEIEDMTPSTLSSSPHIQRFTYGSIQKLLHRHGFKIVEITGSVLFAGPFSNLFFNGMNPVMRLNNKLGSWFPRLAANFYVYAVKVP
jgi:2-polyprenyl-3-methyl-5-hydroxy-6-metoxy-1,4-benzoquinol methylase